MEWSRRAGWNISVSYCPEAIRRMEGSFFNVLSRPEASNWFGSRARRKWGEEGEGEEKREHGTIYH